MSWFWGVIVLGTFLLQEVRWKEEKEDTRVDRRR